tara:strand:+ start:207 stop:929 length:723 start_codon:yes stop_codon:yes gene_type:complete
VKVFNYKDHLIVGGATYAVFTVASGRFTLDGLAVACFFSVLADADQLQSKVSQLLFNASTKVFMILSVVIQFIGSAIVALKLSSHLSFFQEARLTTVLLFLIFFIVLEPNENFIRRRAAETTSLILLLYGLYNGSSILVCAGGICLTYTIAGHRSFVSHSALSLAILYVMVKQLYPVYTLPVLFGYGSHLFVDHVFDHDKCPLAFPVDLLVKKHKSEHTKRDLILITINLLIAGGLFFNA